MLLEDLSGATKIAIIWIFSGKQVVGITDKWVIIHTCGQAINLVESLWGVNLASPPGIMQSNLWSNLSYILQWKVLDKKEWKPKKNYQTITSHGGSGGLRIVQRLLAASSSADSLVGC